MKRAVLVLVATMAMTGSAAAGQTEMSAVLIGFKQAVDHGAVRAAGGSIHAQWSELRAAGAHVPTAALAGLARHPSVEYIEEDRPVHALGIIGSGEDTWGNVAVNANDVRALGITGSGITVCVIDSGIDAAHPEFTRVPAVFGAGYDFVENDSDPTDYGCDLGGCRWGTGHGTHVTGTIVAQLGVGGLGADDPNGIVGVAPGVNMVEYRVLGLDGSGSTTAVINAINACKSLPGKRIASLSLGSSLKSRTEDSAFAAAYDAGVLVFAAAGNDGNTRLSYPAGYASVVSVAAVDANLAKASFSQYNKDVEVAAPGVAVSSSVPRGQGFASSVSVAGTAYPSNALEFSAEGDVAGATVDCGLCGTTSSCGSAPAGFVAFCDRGTYSFAEKVTNAMAQGASAVVIANNDTAAPDDVGSFTLGEAGSWVPTASISYNSGLAIRVAGFGTGEVAVFSGDYAKWDGTSMATPHASACGALVWSAKTSLTNAALRDLLNNTALDLGTVGRDTYFGYGLVDCLKAVQAP